ncbi:MAG: 50S ribosomal protein L11 methyltransferase [Lachnospiraceae bacterium]|jgi:ribosomal protein L11 methyltransferase|nr:50S ribosomal protein L11 methyltransferase [Lachnospiraceae bacterium]
MKWTKIKIKTTPEAAELLVVFLTDYGIEGVQIEDGIPISEEEKKGMFADIVPEPTIPKSVSYLTFYLTQEEDACANNGGFESDERSLRLLISEIRCELKKLSETLDVGDGTIEISETQDIDWINNWKEYFHQFSVGDILIAPSWEEPKLSGNESLIVQIDPGTAFGTGMHETTKLCILEMKKHLKAGDKICDLGCGSGILGMISLLKGADYAMEIDIDEMCVPAVELNMERNGIEENRYSLKIGDVLTEMDFRRDIRDEAKSLKGGGYSIVFANILAETLIPMADFAYDILRFGGVLIASGIIEGKEEKVKEAFEYAGFSILEVNHLGEWAAITAIR